MKISARNLLKGAVSAIVTEGAVNGVVSVALGSAVDVKADITMEAINELGLGRGHGGRAPSSRPAT